MKGEESYCPDGRVDIYHGKYDFAADEYGDFAICSHGVGEDNFEYIRYKGKELYFCPGCGTDMNRDGFFNYIGAHEYIKECLNCNGNYPMCREYCSEYEKETGKIF